mgnify:CR=1 FL=1
MSHTLAYALVLLAVAVILFVWSLLGPVREERPASMSAAPQPAE